VIELAKRRIYLVIGRLATIAMMLGLFTYFAIRMPDMWLTQYNVMTLIEQTACLAIVALGMTVARAAGEMDLSVGSMVSLGTMITVGIIMAGHPIWLAILATVSAGVCLGLANGFMRTTMRIPGVIPTIGSSSAVAGLALIYNWGNMLYGRGPAIETFCQLGRGYIGSISIAGLVTLGMILLTWFLLNSTRFGRLLYMVGGNPDASRLSGVKVENTIRLAYVISGAFAAFAGVMLGSRLGAGNPTAGNDLLLDGIIALMVGSTVLAQEQEFNPIGSVLGAFFISMVITGMQMLGQAYHAQCILRGLLLLVSLALFSLQRRGAE
jgi:ribose/xylose/arabinose/galactoside ABC-type transport system permease subunit